MPNPRGLVGSADIPTLFAPTQGRGGQIKSSAPVRDVGWHALDVRVQERDGLNLVVQVDSHESRIEMMPAMRSLSSLTKRAICRDAHRRICHIGGPSHLHLRIEFADEAHAVATLTHGFARDGIL
jgi:hypothetical protein